VFLNYTNPTNVVTQALADHAGVRVLGLCDQSHGDLTALARALGLPGEPLSFTSIGLNHATWYGEVTLAGLPLPPVPPDLPTPSWVDEEHEIRFALSLELAARHPGRWPNSYLPYYTHPRRFVDLTRRLGPRTDAITARLPAYYTHFEEEGRAVRPDLKLHRGDKDFGDLAVDVLEALDAPEPRRLVLNVPNQGASREFGEGTVVEVAVELGAGGLTRLPAPELPPGEQPFQARLEEYQLRTVGAALSGSMQQAEAALAANPLVPDRATAAALLARAREAYGPKITMFR
jgi:6-phospho-beta-glucosidase